MSAKCFFPRHYILWTDEAIFTPNGVFNRRNFLFWAQENPRVIREDAFQYRTINVWARIIGNRIVSSMFMSLINFLSHFFLIILFRQFSD